MQEQRKERGDDLPRSGRAGLSDVSNIMEALADVLLLNRHPIGFADMNFDNHAR